MLNLITTSNLLAIGLFKKHVSMFLNRNNITNFNFSFINKNYSTNNYSIKRKNSASFLALENIINSKLPNYEKQLEIEKNLRYFWKIELDNLVKSNNFNLGGIGLKLLLNFHKNLNKDLSILLADKKYTKGKPYINDLKLLDISLIISVIISQIFPFCFRYKDLMEQPVTQLYMNIGKKLYREINYKMYENTYPDKENRPSFLDFSSNLPSFNNENLWLDLGVFMVHFIEIKCNLFSITERRFGPNLYRIIIPSDELNSILDDIIFLDSEEIPMLIKPIKWEINSEGLITKFGGYLYNNTEQIKSFFSVSYDNIKAKDIPLNSTVVNLVNKISSVPYCINTKVLDIIESQLYYPYISKDKKSETPLVYFHKHKNSNLLSKFYNNDDLVKFLEILRYNSKYLYDTSIISIANLLKNVSEFYFPVYLDWRGRLYPHGGPLNFQGGELARSLLLFKNGQILNEEGLKALKIYGANAFGLDKKSKIERLKWVNDNIEQIIDTPNNKLWLHAKESLIFLSVAL
jgi:hypothetical protein